MLITNGHVKYISSFTLRNSEKVIEEFIVIYNEPDDNNQCVPKIMPESMYSIKTDIISQITEPYKMETVNVTIESARQFVVLKKNAFKIYGRIFKKDDTYMISKAV